MNTDALEVKINSIQILKNLARNLKEIFFEYVEDVAKLCLEKLINDPFAMTIRKESTKCMRFCIAACADYPDKQKALFIMTYVRLIEEMTKRRQRQEFDQVNAILKELFKMTYSFANFKAKGIMVFTVEDATNFVNTLQGVVSEIRADKEERFKKIKVLAKKVDEEDMEYFLEDIEKVDKGVHHAMELSGFLLRNMGEHISPAIAKSLLPLYATVLLDISDKKNYELIDSVCFICDCMEHGGKAMFDQIQGQAGAKFVEIIKREQAKQDKSYDLIQSCMFGLGLMAQFQTHGQFA